MPYKGDGYLMTYSYDKKSKKYLRSMPWGPHVMADGTRISVDNVLVIKAKQHFGKIYKGSGHDEPLHDIIKTSGKFSTPTAAATSPAPGARARCPSPSCSPWPTDLR